MNVPPITDELRQEAKRFPGGWVYVLKPEYKNQETVPLEGFIGAWKVDLSGNIVGSFIPVSEFSKIV